MRSNVIALQLHLKQIKSAACSLFTSNTQRHEHVTNIIHAFNPIKRG